MRNPSDKEYIFTQHALFEMEQRGLSKQIVATVIENPEQHWEIQQGRYVFQSRVPMGSSEKLFLVRVLLDMDRQPREIVTAYRTSKIDKYWREEQ
ncbi:MAG: DUF4258 domain-containing protein [Thermodesulfobacteriota bacterium]|nr:DUF4258 domain-containing protein [Thermodesulfobacteriota bacterium]